MTPLRHKVLAMTAPVPIPIFLVVPLHVGIFQPPTLVCSQTISISKFQIMSTGVVLTVDERLKTSASLALALNLARRSELTSRLKTLATG
jgi:hypothetical protein